MRFPSDLCQRLAHLVGGCLIVYIVVDLQLLVSTR